MGYTKELASRQMEAERLQGIISDSHAVSGWLKKEQSRKGILNDLEMVASAITHLPGACAGPDDDFTPDVARLLDVLESLRERVNKI